MLTEEDRKVIHSLNSGKLKVVHNTPIQAKFFWDYDKNLKPGN